MAAMPPRKRGHFSILSFFAIVCFFGSIILAMGAYFLEVRHEATLVQKKEELAKKQESFRLDIIDSVRALDTRIRTAEYLMDGHVSPSVLLDILERSTQEEIQYTTFQFVRRPSGNVSVTMLGVAPRFNTVARQAERFASEKLFSHVIFSDLNKPDPKFVTFKVDLDISKDAIAYDSIAPIVTEEANDSESTQNSETESATPIDEEQSTVPQDSNL